MLEVIVACILIALFWQLFAWLAVVGVVLCGVLLAGLYVAYATGSALVGLAATIALVVAIVNLTGERQI